jgi:cytochrome d ubiquinol oxidase subunit II
MNFTLDLNTIWFALVGMMFIGYAVLDGFDLGIGALHLFTRENEHRRILLNAIGPVWDGNEVWLVTGGGALFAAFPDVYATAFSGFYMAMILLLFGLIFRAVAIEFRSKRDNAGWRLVWDISFSASSIVSSLIVGIALGNIARGIPLDQNREFTGGFLSLLSPYSLLVGTTTVALFMMHGAIYAVLKTEGRLHEQIRAWVNNTIIFFVICYVTVTMATLLYIPHMADKFKEHPVLFFLPVLNMLAIANIPREIHHNRDFPAFLSSCAAIIAMLALFGIGMYPYLIISSPAVANSISIYNGASSQKTLGIMTIIAIIGIPLIIAYTVSVYYIFRGKVKLAEHSY